MATPERLIMVSVDGLAAAALHAPAVALPTLRGLAARGAQARALRPAFPSVTWPCHASLVTGVEPRRHGVLGNHVFDRDRGRVVEHYGDRSDSPVAVEALWDRVRAAGGRVASLCWPKTRGVAAIADNIPEFYDQELFEAYASPELWRELRRRGLPVDRYGPWSACHSTTPMQDWLTLEVALHLLATRPPRLMLLHFLTLDSIQHDHGVASPVTWWALAHADALLGRLVATLEALGRLETTALMVFGDHGFVDVDTTYHLNQVLCEEGLLDLDGQGRVARRRAWAASNGGSAHVYVLDGAGRSTADRLRERLGALPGVEVLDDDPVRALGLPAPGSHPMQGDLMLVGAPSVQFTDHATPEAAGAAPRYRATHGHAPDLPALGAAFLMAGPGVAEGVALGKVSVLAVAPTAARLLGVDLLGAAGATLAEALTCPEAHSLRS